jgi:hypothetical protein
MVTLILPLFQINNLVDLHFLLQFGFNATYLCRLENYEARVRKGLSELDRCIWADLSPLEEHLLKSQELVEIRGKVSIIGISNLSVRMNLIPLNFDTVSDAGSFLSTCKVANTPFTWCFA